MYGKPEKHARNNLEEGRMAFQDASDLAELKKILANNPHAIFVNGYKLDKWRQFCEWIKKLPYAEELIIGKKIEPKKELTYGEIYAKFLAAIAGSSDTIVDWRPYPLKKNSIIVWRSEYLGCTFKPPIEVAYQLVDEKRNEFHLIEDAKRLKDILEMEGKEADGNAPQSI